MSTNPNNAIGTNGAFGGRTSVNAFNDIMGALSRGVLSGWACVPNSGLTVSLGGDGTTRDVAIAEDNAGNKTSINNISNSPVNVTIGAAPGANSRIDSIVAYVDNPPTGNASETDNPDACGLIVVEGTPASTPSPANDGAIRTAITADGASGTTAYYVVLAYVTMASGTTDITSGEISAGAGASLTGDGVVKSQNIDFAGLSGNYSTTEQATEYTWIDGRTIYKKTIDTGTLPNATYKTVPTNITNLRYIIKMEGGAYSPSSQLQLPLPFAGTTEPIQVYFSGDNSNLNILAAGNATDLTVSYITLYYTKN